MSDDRKDVKLSLTVMVNKEKNKVLYAVADHHFTDILMSFLTLPLGRIVKVLEKHYGDKAPAIGSLNSLYHSLANLDSTHFWTHGAKNALLDQSSSFEAEYERLELDITDYLPAQYFYCTRCNARNKFRSVSIYYDYLKYCRFCKLDNKMSIREDRKVSRAIYSDGVFVVHTASFIISDDLQILPYGTGLLRIITVLGITSLDDVDEIKVDLRFNEIMKLLKVSLTSLTPLSDVILNKTAEMNTARIPLHEIVKEENPNTGNLLSFKVMIQKSTGKFLYAEAKEKFIEFLFGLLLIPLGGAGKTCFKAINNLYRSTSEFIDGEYFKTPDMKNRLMQLNLPDGYISEDHILPLTQEPLPDHYTDYLHQFSSTKFPNGQGSYLEGPRTYQVMDDLTVMPYCFVSILSSLREQEIQLSDVKELDLQIGLKEALRILKASVTSTSAITDALLSQITNKQPKREV